MSAIYFLVGVVIGVLLAPAVWKDKFILLRRNKWEVRLGMDGPYFAKKKEKS